MKISIGCDHAGPELKNKVMAILKERGHECVDLGTSGPGSVDYPDFGKAVASSVSKGETDRGILICGTGIGMSIVANKFQNIRATLCYDIFTARMSRLHNDSNILVLGSRTTETGLALSILDIWLNTDFEGGRHQDRLNKISEMEKVICNG
ncbi:MAG: ribose 5-phosphate isomerase B [Nitrospirota bacterium]|nr:MAG: ribose 5-phosphate isomerase B [Nitrospirota bacterium]